MASTYITPTGSGDKSGSSWANAASIGSLDAMVKKAGAGGTVLLAADKGDYVLKAPLGITGSGVTISGVNTDGSVGEAHFVGTRAANWTAGAAAGNELFRIAKGADNLTFQNMQIDNTGTAFRVTGDVKGLTVQHIDADNVQRFFEDYVSGSNKTATISGLTIRDIDVAGFSKGAIRLQYDTNNVLIEDVRADSERQDGDNFAMGVHLDDTVHDVVLRRVTMENATQDRGTGYYWNGDGFTAEQNTYNLTFEDTVARGNTDAGYDIKSDHVTMIRALAEDNARNFRFWGEDVKVIDSVGLNPHIRGGSSSQTQIWVHSSANVTVIDSSFSDAGSKTAVVTNEGKLTLINTTIEQAVDAKTVVGNTPTGMATTEITKVSTAGTSSQGSSYSDGTIVTDFVKAIEIITPPTSGANTPVGTSGAETGAWKKVVTTTASETIVATSFAEMFVIDQTRATGKDVIKGFGANDTILFSQRLGDGDGNGVTTFGSDGILDLSAGNSVRIDGLKKGLRLIEETAEGFVYGDAGVWKAGAKLPTAATETTQISTAANDIYLATNARDTFVFDVSAGKTGTDTVRGFGRTDAIVTKIALVDGNKDGLIEPGKLGLDLGGGNLVQGLSTLRVMGSTSEGFVYADAAVRPKKAIEGKLTVADTLTGGKTDTATDTFFFDTALHRALGADKVINFGAKDVIVTTSQIGSGAAGSHVQVAGGGFALSDTGLSLGSVAVTDLHGAAVSTLEFDGMKTLDGVSYFVYSSVGSAAGLDALV